MGFSQPGRSQQLWQQLQIEQYWGHHDRPPGQRFLGSMRISRNVVEQLLHIVCSSFAPIQPFTFAELEEEFSGHDPQNYWIRLSTLALSEYAYYDEGHTGFWEGVCDRLGLQRTQGVENTLRAVLKKGIKLLGLVETQQSNYYVSTLWLQSGIPQQNLEHFARLLQDISQEYSWWEIAHAEPEDLSQMMYEFCLHRHPQWRKLLTFLKSSYAEDDEAVEPISGQLLQGIAIVAQELERRGLSPAILQDSQQQEQFLHSYCLPSTFFLRSWDNLIQVLTPQEQSQTTRRGIIDWRKKPLVLALDVADSMDIQLCLPEQRLYRKDWKALSRSHCKITEISWEGDIDLGSGIVEIPAKNRAVHHHQPSWTWQLRSHTDASLTEWHCEGIAPNLPVLIFDAWTGDRLLFSSELKGSTEIICFFASSTQLEFSDGIELLDGFVPCSIAGWRGQQLLLTAAQSELTVRFANGTQSFLWSQVQANHPQLRGLKLKGRQPVYLDVPTIWHPPLPLSKTVKILVEDLTHRAILTALDETLTVAANANWQSIQLSQWITRSGSYVVRLWTEDHRWSEQFEVKSSFELNQPPHKSVLVVCDRTQTPMEIPLQVPAPADFWLSELTLHGLWALEEIMLLLTGDAITRRYRQQATISGVLTITLAAWRDVLPESNGYALSYQRQGEAPQRLLEMVSGGLISQTWANQAIHLSGLHPGQTYILTFWNMMLPDNKILQRIVRALPEQDAVTVPLNDLWGLFHVQLECSSGAAQSLGWWSGIQTITNLLLPEELSNDRFEYSMNIFENQPVGFFSAEVRRLDLDIDVQAVNRAIASLENDPCHLPGWLDRDLLHQKLQVFLKSPANPKANVPVIVSINGQKVTPPQPGRWYLVTIRPNNNSQSIFSRELRRRDNSHLIERCEIPPCNDYLQYILIKTSNLSSEILELICQTPYFQRIERRPLSLNQVTQMLGRNPDAA
ncbi:hypothetical protein L3556_13855 [Candidatus Synechococcus calcipolaris G9]|uniref:Uncharacterized protein n=1 Tax=Candidatus Synechococcus calcipolaris G9 TaxID=1497997 RepID=A0ABT6F2C8_9SYNE|nr:hypothetical protein [Candidatus Synechococcus calcipolaris]MDG2992006.1 hypothetical protein [Candidatus Synechococcus calcipolaris G9]